MSLTKVERVAVIGAGTMGSGIAQVSATSGFHTTLIDISAEALTRAKQSIQQSVEKLFSKGKIDETARQNALEGIVSGTDLALAAEADLIIEAVTENKPLKLKLFAELDALAKPSALLASNTSSISITSLAAATKRPSQVIGMHFMNPVPLMPLVELVRGLDTSAETVAVALEVCRAMGKTALEANDSPGFISNRILMPMINEAIFCLMEGVGTAEAIDGVMKLGMNHPMGPLALADFIGLDVCLAILEVLHSELGEDKYRPCPLLRKMVAAGYYGRKTGRGFYTYTT
ncbi:MAG: 3-hydroxybutyryl-CoA dehydrogenase [Chloroflexi bacterium]|nr:3-hydroxybutyryl-CoA dehydrogenase [Chloroflexota bacterium]